MKANLLYLFLALPAVAASADSVTTPEPATMLLVGAGLLAVGLVARRRNKNK